MQIRFNFSLNNFATKKKMLIVKSIVSLKKKYVFQDKAMYSKIKFSLTFNIM